jgi:fructosamine-3-kinase
MARLGTIASRAESLLGVGVVATTPVAGGDICTGTRLRLTDGRSAFCKTRPHAPVGFFEAEARGLAWLAEAQGAAVPKVLAHTDDCLILEWLEAGRPTAEAAEQFGRALVATHQAAADGFGAAEDGYIGTVPLINTSSETWPEFWAQRRLLPYLKVARDREAIAAADAEAVERVANEIDRVAGPSGPAARLHGDLWSGNLMWPVDGPVHLVDPAAYGGHRETDLAMLMLFGAPHLSRIIDAYDEAAPLADGWTERVPLHQIHPLLVHAILFGGGYGQRAGDAARAVLDPRPSTRP